MRVVVDEGVPRQLVKALIEAGIDACRFKDEWRQTTNGALIAIIEADGFGILLTNDKNIASQQSSAGRNVAVIALPLNRRSAIMARIADIVDTIRRAQPGKHVVMALDGSRTVTSVIDDQSIEHDMPSVATFKAR